MLLQNLDSTNKFKSEKYINLDSTHLGHILSGLKINYVTQLEVEVCTVLQHDEKLNHNFSTTDCGLNLGHFSITQFKQDPFLYMLTTSVDESIFNLKNALRSFFPD